MVTEATFEKQKNDEYKANKVAGKITSDKISKCLYCDFQPTDYMGLVKHRETEHGIPRGKSDVYTP